MTAPAPGPAAAIAAMRQPREAPRGPSLQRDLDHALAALEAVLALADEWETNTGFSSRVEWARMLERVHCAETMKAAIEAALRGAQGGAGQ